MDENGEELNNIFIDDSLVGHDSDSEIIDEQDDLKGDIVAIYARDMRKFKMLNKKEEQELAKEISGKREGLAKILNSLPLAKRIRESFQSKLDKINEELDSDLDFNPVLDSAEKAIERIIVKKSLDEAEKLIGEIKGTIQDKELSRRIKLETDLSIKKFLFFWKNISEKQDVIRRREKDFVNANLRLSFNMAKHYMGLGLHLIDLVQEGNVGLIKAVERFDCGRGYKFSTYAFWWIRQSLLRALSNQSRTIRISANMVNLMRDVAKVSKILTGELGRYPSVEEVAEEMNLPAEKIEEILEAGKEPISLETPIGKDEDSLLIDFIEDTNCLSPIDSIFHDQRKEQIAKIIATLPPREADVIRKRFGFDCEALTLEEIGEDFKVTRERIRQIEVAAFKKLKHPTRLINLKVFHLER